MVTGDIAVFSGQVFAASSRATTRLTGCTDGARLPPVREVVVFGASGYSGLELLRRLSVRPRVKLFAASSDRWAGQRIAGFVPRAPADLRFAPHAEVEREARRGQAALLATPTETSAALAPRLVERGLTVVDLSGAFRLTDPAVFREWYGFEHPAPDWLDRAVYGLPELVAVPQGARLVANPGCYATAAILATAPLLRAGLVEPGRPLVLDGKSGTTGAGRTLREDLLFSEVADNVRPYRVARHQHTPEIERALELSTGQSARVGLTAHLVPMRRGLLVSAYVPARPGVDVEAVVAAYRTTFRHARYVRWVDRPPETRAVVEDNFVEVHAALDPRTETIMAFAALDNLVKGAAGQALQNLDDALGDDGHAE